MAETSGRDRQGTSDPEPPEAPAQTPARTAEEAGPLAQRVSDAERDRTVTLLREHVVDGRLTLDEFSERVGRALQATTQGDLDAVMVDLPSATTHLPEPSTSTRKSRRWHVAVMSGHDTKGRWRIGGKTTAVAVMGGCDLDLRRAEIEGPEVEITAVAFWGGVKVIVPEGFDVELRGFSFMGGRSIRLRDVPIVPGSPRIVVRGFAIMGGVDVRSRSSRSGRQAAKALSQSAQGLADALAAHTGSGSGFEALDISAITREIRRQLTVDRRAMRRDPAVRPPGTHTQHKTVPPSPPPPPTPPGWPMADRGGESVVSETGASEATPTPFEAVPTGAVAPAVTDGTVTILFCDMVDYAGMTERLGDHVSRELLRDHHRIVREALGRHGGREINVQGDGFMIAFPGVARALRCAIDIQRGFLSYVPPPRGERLEVHIGIHTGDALTENDDYLGLTVIVASRLADAAGPGEILVSSLSEQLVAGSGEFTFSGHRETRLKGMARAQLSATLSWA
jgi:class 3 adenylate cyclase